MVNHRLILPILLMVLLGHANYLRGEEPGALPDPVNSAQVAPLPERSAIPKPEAPPTPYEALLKRLEETEYRLQQLEEERRQLAQPPEEESSTGHGLQLTRFLALYDPEVAAAREQIAEEDRRLELPPELPEAPGQPRAVRAREPRWYEKYSLRGYTQFRTNEVFYVAPGSAPPQFVGDGSVGRDRNFLIRRARIIIQGPVSEYVYIYFQPDFASDVSGATRGVNHFTQLRDWYADIFFDKTQIFRLRVGQSKVPYGWENMQSSSNRVPLDRTDAINSVVRNERDLGVFFYWTPIFAQKIFRYVLAENLKGSGNYGVFAFGAYNGQGGSFAEQNENLHLVSRLTVPYELPNGQIIEAGIQGVTGKYAVFSGTIRPLGLGAPFNPGNTLDGTIVAQRNRAGIRDERLAGTFILYPQPFGFQAEWTIGRGPALNATQTRVEERALYGGYLMALMKIDTSLTGLFYPFVRWQYFRGGHKGELNAPFCHVDEWEFGAEWQIKPSMELTLSYCITDRTNTTAVNTPGVVPYRQFDGQFLRCQFQVNY